MKLEEKIKAFKKPLMVLGTSSGAGKEEAMRLGIRGFPTTKILKDGKVYFSNSIYVL